MGPTSDLGPVDPQFRVNATELAPAHAIIAAVDEAERRIEQNPATSLFHLGLATDITALMVQDARNAMERISTLISEVLACVESRSERDVEKLSKTLRNYLVSKSKNHGSVVSVSDAKRFGLPVIEADPADDQWRAIWRLWAKYILIETYRVYEGEQVSVIGGLSVSA